MDNNQATTDLSSLDRAILDRIQADFPVSADPYGDLGAAVGVTREEAHAAVLDLRRRGIIRRIGGSFAAKKLGYTSTLVAARVIPDRLDAAAAAAGAFPEVTHNYERNGIYNLWFTVISPTPARLEEILAVVRSIDGVQALHSLPALQTFKIRVDFRFGGEV